VWIKICGMTTPEAVVAALDAGVDAIGFVFAPSVRRVTPEGATKLAAPARGRVRCVAVMRHPTQQELDAVLSGFNPDVLQTDWEDLRHLGVPEELDLLPVLRAEPPPESPELPRRLLFEGMVSGSGQRCDWTAARRIAGRSQLVLAGGLNADNMAAAIAEVAPFGVDVSSGVEERPGVKSPVAIANFVLAARRGGARNSCVGE
jgi:phosphoribosylanthranilate isomerase